MGFGKASQVANYPPSSPRNASPQLSGWLVLPKLTTGFIERKECKIKEKVLIGSPIWGVSVSINAAVGTVEVTYSAGSSMASLPVGAAEQVAKNLISAANAAPLLHQHWKDRLEQLNRVEREFSKTVDAVVNG